MRNISLNQFENYLISKRLSARTLREYMYYFQKFKYNSYEQESINHFLSDKGNRNIISRAFLKNLKEFLLINYKELGYSKEERFDISETELPKITGRKEKLIIRPLSEEEIINLETYLEKETDKLKLLISFYSGLRSQELLTLRVISFNWSDWKKDISQYGECIVYGKGSKERRALIPPKLMERIRDFIKQNFSNPNDYLFIKKNDKSKLESVARDWRKILNEIGIKSKLTNQDEQGNILEETRVHPHRLRHSCAYYLMNHKGFNTSEVQQYLGHSDIKTTQLYIHIDNKHLKEKLKDGIKEN